LSGEAQKNQPARLLYYYYYTRRGEKRNQFAADQSVRPVNQFNQSNNKQHTGGKKEQFLFLFCYPLINNYQELALQQSTLHSHTNRQTKVFAY
jgi:hypothetical protein